MDPKSAARQRLQASSARLVELSHTIHANPETAYEEVKASAWLAQELEEGGFKVERGICELPTAFAARAGRGPLHVAICAEYDSLPGIGHACGHNIIAASALGAAIALAPAADELGLSVSVIGTPAEEGGGGKVLLVRRGAFAGVHAAMMVHPAPFDILTPPILAASLFEVRYAGKEAHASAFPELGVNAADALTIAQTAIGLLRQHIRPSDRVHGIVTKGGDAPNIVPAHTSASYIVRARTLAEVEELRTRIDRCFEAGALATGAKLQFHGGDRPYAEMHHDAAIAALYQHNACALGRSFPDLGGLGDRMAGSTDMGNVSLATAAIHPMIGIDSLPAVNHQPEFAAHCVSAAADRAIGDAALAMAWTVIDLAADPSLRARLLGEGQGGDVRK